MSESVGTFDLDRRSSSLSSTRPWTSSLSSVILGTLGSKGRVRTQVLLGVEGRRSCRRVEELLCQFDTTTETGETPGDPLPPQCTLVFWGHFPGSRVARTGPTGTATSLPQRVDGRPEHLSSGFLPTVRVVDWSGTFPGRRGPTGLSTCVPGNTPPYFPPVPRETLVGTEDSSHYPHLGRHDNFVSRVPVNVRACDRTRVNEGHVKYCQDSGIPDEKDK